MKTIDIMLLLLINLLWGGCYIVTKEMLYLVKPLTLAALRFTVVAGCLLPYLKKPQIKLPNLLLTAVMLSVGHIYLSQVVLDSGMAVSTMVVILELGVPLTSVFTYFMLNQSFTRYHLLGFVLAILATMVIFGTPEVLSNITPALLAVVSSLTIAYVNVFITKHQQIDVSQMVGWLAVLSTPVMWLLAFAYGEHITMSMLFNTKLILGLIFLSVISVVFAEVKFYDLMRQYTVNKVVIFLVLVPVSGVIMSWLFYNEVLGRYFWLGFAVMIASIMAVFYADRRLNQE
ncbi:MAG: DMT family transporter [Pseudomonadota bacterium]